MWLFQINTLLVIFISYQTSIFACEELFETVTSTYKTTIGLFEVRPTRRRTIGSYTMQDYLIYSGDKAFNRTLTVALDKNADTTIKAPVVFMTDGQVLDQLIVDIENNNLKVREKPAAFVALFSSSEKRNEEYISRAGDDTFDTHAKVFTEIIPDIADQILGRKLSEEERVAFGFSCGGGFVFQCAIQNPGIFGKTIAGSVVGPRSMPDLNPNRLKNSVFYFFSGTKQLEKFARANTLRKVTALEENGVRVININYEGDSHDWHLWSKGFQNAFDNMRSDF